MTRVRQIKKTLEIPIEDEVYDTPITFALLEVVERVFEVPADEVPRLLTPYFAFAPHLGGNPQRSKVAEIIAGWITESTGCELSRNCIREVVGFSLPDRYNVYVGCIQGALLFAWKRIDEEQLNTLSKGESLESVEDENDKEDDEGKAEAGPDS